MASSLFQRIGYNRFCFDASVLSAEPIDASDLSSLKEAASQDGLSYGHIVKDLGSGCYLLHISSDPDCLPSFFYTLVLSDEDLLTALPWDCRLASLTPQEIVRRLEASGMDEEDLSSDFDEDEEEQELLPLPEISFERSEVEQALQHAHPRQVQRKLLALALNQIHSDITETYGVAKSYLSDLFDRVLDIQSWHKDHPKHPLVMVSHGSPSNGFAWGLNMGLPVSLA